MGLRSRVRLHLIGAVGLSLTVVAPVVVMTAPANLVAAYSYDEGAGMTVADASVSSNSGMLSGATWSTACKIGKCLSFNGTSSFVESPDINALSPGVNATFEAWVLLPSAPTELASIVNKWNQSIDDEYLVGITPGRTVFFAWHTTGGNTWPSASFNQAVSTGTIPLNAWTHIAVVRSGAALTFYINGVANTLLTVIDANPFRNGVNTLRVGGQGRGANRFFKGSIDDLRIYNRALTATEVAADMTPPLPANAPVAAYSYDEGAGTTVVDGSVFNNSGAMSGAAWSTACKLGKCLSFNGASSFVESPDINPLTPGVNATFEAWVLLPSAPIELTSIVNKWNQTVDDEYIFGITPGRTLLFAWHTTGGNSWPSTSFNQAVSTGTLPLNAWTHIAVVRSGTVLTFYINGVANTSLTVMDGSPFRNGVNTLRVGAQGRGAKRFFAGSIDELRIYNRALTAAEIIADMGPGTGSDVTPPVISLTAPTPNAMVSRLVTVSANATDNVGVTGVQFKLDGVNLGLEDAASPFTVLWDSTTASAGQHTLTAVAFDVAGNQATSVAVVVTVSNNSQLTLAWDANVEPTLAGYRLYMGNSSGVYSTSINVGNVTSVTVTTLQAGRLYFFAVTAYDQAGIESGFSNEISTSAP